MYTIVPTANNMKPAPEIPLDVWTSISDLIVNPSEHIALSQVCQIARNVYTGEDKWKMLCRAIGVGRGGQEKKEPWKKIYVEVASHRKGCKMPQCYHYGVPPTNVIGDLLPTPKSIAQHTAYIEKHRKCSCGLSHGDGEEGEGHAGSNPDAANDDDDNADDDADAAVDAAVDNFMNAFLGAAIPVGGGAGAGAGAPPAAPAATGPGPAPAPAAAAAPPPPPAPAHGPQIQIHGHVHHGHGAPPGLDPNAMMASFLTMLGMAPGPGGAFAPIPVPGMPGVLGIPLGHHPLAPAGPAGTAGPAIPGAAVPGAATNSEPPETATPATPPAPIIPHLLPMSMKNREDVPKRPRLHVYLADTGSVQFQRFLQGKTSLFPFAIHGGVEQVGIDWDGPNGARDDWEKRNLVEVADHPLLNRAFACNPPVTEMHFELEQFRLKVSNKDGVTIQDVIFHMNRFLNKPLSAADKTMFCPHENRDTAEEPSEVFATRLAFLLRVTACTAGRESNDDEKEVVKELYLRGINQSRDNKVICSLFPY